MLYSALGNPGIDERTGGRNYSPASSGEVSRCQGRIISDNGPQFVAKDFKEFIRICGMTHVRTSPYYAQSNGKIERWHKSIKAECIRPGVPLSLEDAERIVGLWVHHYNTVGSTARSATLRPWTSSKVAKLKSSPRGIASRRKLVSRGNNVANKQSQRRHLVQKPGLQ
jgi:hypothetical protein